MRGWLKNKPIIEIVFLIACAAIMGYLLLVEPIIGLADHGDYFRIMWKVGLKSLTDVDDERYFWYITPLFGHREPVKGSYYFSSEEYLAHIAVGLDTLCTRDEYFSLPVMGGVHMAFFLGALCMLFFGLRRLHSIQRIVFCGLCWFMFCDVGYIAWFNSLYSEPASTIFLFMAIALALLISRHRDVPVRRWILGGAYYAAAFLFLTAKPQNGPCGIVLVVLGYIVTMNPNKEKRRMLPVMAGVVPGIALLLLSFWLTFVGQPEYMKRTNIYGAVFADLLKYSPDPVKDMKELDIYNPDFLELVGYEYFDVSDSLLNSAAFKEGFYDKIGYVKLLKFYLRHPDRFYNLIDRVSHYSYTMRPPSMGNYEHSAAPLQIDAEGNVVQPGEPLLCYTFSGWSTIKNMIFPKSGLFLIVFFLVNVIVAAVKILRFDRTPFSVHLSLVHLSVALLAAMQFFVSILGQGESSIIKHLYLYNILFDALLIILVLYLIGFISLRIANKKIKAERI